MLGGELYVLVVGDGRRWGAVGSFEGAEVAYLIVHCSTGLESGVGVYVFCPFGVFGLGEGDGFSISHLGVLLKYSPSQAIAQT